MRSVLAVCAALALSACFTPPGNFRASATRGDLGPYRAFSWGKANVSLADYNTVAFECTSRGVLSPDLPRAPENPLTGVDPGAQMMELLYRDQMHAQADQRQRQRMVEACLQEFGFTPFGLTDAQLAHLETLPRGTVERRLYLHGLGSDPAILEAQRL